VKLQERAARFWAEDRGLSFLLLFLVIFLIVAPLRESGPIARTLLGVTFSLMLVSGVLAVSRRRWAGIVTGVIAAFAFIAEWAFQWSGSPALDLPRTVGSLLFTATLAGVVFAQVIRGGRITIHRILGSATAYLLIGFTWGAMYNLLGLLDPGAFASSTFPRLGQGEYFYFSIVTLTTLGYGDITPLHPLARSLVSLEALTGQLFPAILIARLVSMELLERQSGSSDV
jgi:voltage-gated potassium channel Kch